MTPPSFAAERSPLRRHTHRHTAAMGSSAEIFTSTASPNTIAAHAGRSAMSSSTPASTPKPTSASLCPPLTMLITMTGLTPRNATAAGDLVRRQISQRQRAAAIAATVWK